MWKITTRLFRSSAKGKRAKGSGSTIWQKDAETVVIKGQQRPALLGHDLLATLSLIGKEFH